MSPIAIASVRGQINDNILALVRREVEQAEMRLKAEIARLRDTVALTLEKHENKNDKVLAVVNQKLVNHETAQTKLEKTVSALSGSVQGLSGVVQEQIQRAHGVDSRIWEMRHQLEDIFMRRCGEIEQLHHDGATKWHAAHSIMEDLHKQHHDKFRRLEEHLQDLAGAHDGHANTLNGVHERLAQIEEIGEQALQTARDAHSASQARSAQHAQELAAIAASQCEDGDARLLYAEQQLQDVDQRLRQLTFEAHDDKGWEATMKVHEAKLKEVRAKLDSLEEHYQGFDDRVRARSDVENRINQLQRSYQELANRSYDDVARVDAVASRLEAVEQCFDELRQEGLMVGSSQIPYLQATLESLAGVGQYPLEAMAQEPTFGGRAPDTRDLVQSIQRRIDSIQDANSGPMAEDVPRSARSQMSEAASAADGHGLELQHRLGELIAQLQEVVPKVKQHDDMLAAAQGAAEAAELAAKEARAKADEALEARGVTPREVAVLPESTQAKIVEDCSRKVMDSLALPGGRERQQLEKLVAEVTAARVGWDGWDRSGSCELPGRMGETPEAVAKVEQEVHSQLQTQQESLQKLQQAVGTIGQQLHELCGAVNTILTEPSSDSRDYDPTAFNVSVKTAMADLAACGAVVSGAGGTTALPPDDQSAVDDDIAQMYNRVEESERAAQQLQDALKARISKMEKLMDSVQKDIAQPYGDSGVGGLSLGDGRSGAGLGSFGASGGFRPGTRYGTGQGGL